MTEPPAERKLRVAVIDDEPTLLVLVGGVLRARGHTTELYANGLEALAFMVRVPPDLVVCDVEMPEIKGYELCARLGELLGERAPPVIMLSAVDDEERVGRSLDAGARFFVRKPVVPGELLALVDRATRARQRVARPEAPATPRQLGPYRILGELGQGGMGVVYRARREGQTHEVAVKVLRGGASTEDELRFRRELDVLASLDHPGVARLIESGSEAGRVFYAMELVPGRTLAAEIAVHGPLDARRVARIGSSAAAALAYVHARKIVHRDVKPSNLILGPNDRPKLVDFGLARSPKDLSLSTPNVIVGSLLYLAPEFSEQPAYSPASDVFALGMTLLEAIAGRHPARRLDEKEPSSVSILLRFARRQLPGLAALTRPGVPAEVRRLVEAALAPLPGERPDAATLAAELAHVPG